MLFCQIICGAWFSFGIKSQNICVVISLCLWLVSKRSFNKNMNKGSALKVSLALKRTVDSAETNNVRNVEIMSIFVKTFGQDRFFILIFLAL